MENGCHQHPIQEDMSSKIKARLSVWLFLSSCSQKNYMLWSANVNLASVYIIHFCYILDYTCSVVGRKKARVNFTIECVFAKVKVATYALSQETESFKWHFFKGYKLQLNILKMLCYRQHGQTKNL